jgi:hypothetical protein
VVAPGSRTGAHKRHLDPRVVLRRREHLLGRRAVGSWKVLRGGSLERGRECAPLLSQHYVVAVEFQPTIPIERKTERLI